MEIAGLPGTAGEETTLSDAWDFKGRRAIQSRTGGWVCAATSLVVEMGERLATLSIAVNLGPYLRGTMHLGSADSANIITNFLGTSFILCLFGGFIADTFLGRYLTIAVFTAVQACGVTILTISTMAPGLRPPACAGPSSGGCVLANGLQMGMLYLGLFTTALGTGGLKSSVSGFGSDQFDESDKIEKKQMMKFFRYFFFFINVGSILAVTVMVYIQDHLGRRWGYGICAVAIIAGLALFLSKTNRYRFKKLVGSPLTQFAAVVACAWRKRRLALPEDPSILYDIDTSWEMASLPETAEEGKTLADAWDFKGRPAVKSTTGGWTSAAMILGVELCERMTTLGIAVNLVTYLTGTMHLGNAASANVVTNFLGTSFMLCLLGGFVADTYLGRYLTIAIFTAIQASGVTILTISTAAPGLRPPECSNPLGGGCVRANGTQLGVLFLGLYLTALGTGGLKSSVSGFGSDQFDEGDRAEKKQMMRFFSWFFFFISIGALMAVTVLVYIQDNVGRRWGYGICAVAIVAGLAVFLSGTSRYRFKRLAGSPLSQIASVVVSAWRKRRLDVPDSSMLHDIDTAEGCSAPEASKKKQKLPHTKQFRFLDRAAIVEGDATVDQTKWRLSTLTDVEEVKQVIRMLPTWATTIMFWTVYAQMTTFSVSQASTMDRHIGPSFEIPAGSLTVFFVGSILITVPIYDRIIVPAARRLTGNPQGVTPLQRIAVGLVLSIVAMCAAALTERKRLRAARTDPTAAVVPLTVFWLVPQFLLVGAGEAFTYIGQLDFFLRECPKGMKTMSTGLFLSTLSLGFFLSSALVTIVHKVTGESGKGAWLPDDLNKGKLYDFYWLLAALSVLNLVVFAAAARGYVYKEKRMGDESVNGFLLVGAGEAFTYIGQLDFFLRECPKGMKTMSTGLFLSTLAGLLPELRAGHHSPQGDGGEREGGVAAGRPEQREAVRLLLAAGGAERAEPGGLRGGRQGLRLQGEEDGGRERQRGGAGGGGLLPCMSCSSKTCSV
ncbi:Nitrate transporter 1.1 [Musa troglodytarum]|uniref:Nitrate transporter 1.1 n=1 Tax=Musa troglodytarum TaxID=320322 RepID=A0A9E7JJG9_9LILI|nr:Nitrate transporter 1.1 [Musa troglodytarum]